MKKGKLKYIVLIVILIVYGVVMYLAFGVNESKERAASTTLLVGDFTVWNYSSRDWMNIRIISNISSRKIY